MLMKKIWKKAMCVLLTLAMVITAMMPMTVFAAKYGPSDLNNSSWAGYQDDYALDDGGQYHILKWAYAYTFESCDSDGNLKGTAYISCPKGLNKDTVSDGDYCKYTIKGTFDFNTGTVKISYGGKILSQDSRSNYYFQDMTYQYQGESLTGTFDLTGISSKDIILKDAHADLARTSKWSRDEIADATSYGLVPDTIQGKDMTKPVTRAEFAAISLKLYETIAETEVQPGYTQFQDISGNENEDAIEKAYQVGIVSGYSLIKFAPDQHIWREQMAAMLTRAVQKYRYPEWTPQTSDQYYLDTSGAKRFTDDSKIAAYAKPSVYFLAKYGIIAGVDSTHFAPKATTSKEKANGYATATREQAIALSLRIYKMKDQLK